MCMQNIFNGVIWFVLPVLLVCSNDTFAYIWGFFLGKKYIQVPLINLSVSKKISYNKGLFLAEKKLGRVYRRWNFDAYLGLYLLCFSSRIPNAILPGSAGSKLACAR